MHRHHIICFLSLISVFCLTGCFGTQAPAPVASYGAGKGGGGAGYHTVQPDDTLYSLSRRYKIVMRDIVVENSLSDPFILNIGQRIKLPPPRRHKVKAGDTLYGISRLYDVNMNEIARLNDLHSPYVLHKGQVVRLPSKYAASPPAKAKPSSAARVAHSSDRTVKAQKPSVKKASLVSKPPKRAGRFYRPVNGTVISSFGPKKNGLHNDGINIRAPKGTPVRSAENGVIAYAGNELKGSGNLILVRHEGRLMSAYAHLDKISVKRGQKVKAGDVIGTVGSTGSVSEPQLHFEIRKGTRAKNPQSFI